MKKDDIKELTDIDINKEIINTKVQEANKIRINALEETIEMTSKIDSMTNDINKEIKEKSKQLSKKEKPKIRIDGDVLEKIREKIDAKTDSERIELLWQSYIEDSKDVVNDIMSPIPLFNADNMLDNVNRIKNYLDAFAQLVITDINMYSKDIENQVLTNKLMYIEDMRGAITKECLETRFRAQESEELSIVTQKKNEDLNKELEIKNTEISRLSNLLNTVQESLNNKNNELDVIQKDLKTVTSENAELKEIINKNKESYSNNITALENKHIEDMRHSKDDFEKEIALLREKIEELTEENTKLNKEKHDIASYKMQLEFANSKVVSLEQDKENLLDDKKELKETIAKLRERMDK